MSENKRMVLKIAGMHCNGCAMSVTRALKKVTGVVSAEVHLSSNTAVVEAGEDVTLDALTAAVKKAGYKAEGA
jgi:copper chaperone CopZ